MEYKLPEGTNSTRVAHDLEEIEVYLKKRPEVTHVTTSIGGTPARYNLVRNVANPSLSYGELIIDFTSPDDLVDNMAEIQQYLSQHYPDAYVKMNRYNLMFKNTLLKRSLPVLTLLFCISWRIVPARLWRIVRMFT